MPNEIGSEFWEADLCEYGNPIIESTHQYFLAGRTALDFIIKDIKSVLHLAAVLMPSYCCHSMIQPFVDNNVDVEFYDVSFENGRYISHIDPQTRCSAVFVMQYFGYCDESWGSVIKRLRDNGKIVIEDATHSWFSKSKYSRSSDYVFASFRKWTGLPCGAVAIRQNDIFSSPGPTDTNYKYIEMRRQAAKLKRMYIEEGVGEKKVFLSMFDEAEKLLDGDYQDYGLPVEYQGIILSLDSELIRRRRQANAEHLLEGLRNCNGVECVHMTKRDAPLFVPIVVLDEKRNELRQHLINNEVYCPIHWPISALHRTNKLWHYENSLSIVCDQRYAFSDMNRVITLINEFFGG